MDKTLLFIKTYLPFVFFVALVVVSVFWFQTCTTLKKERADQKYQEKQNTQNLNALKDSITVSFNKKLNAYEFSKDNFVVQRLSDLEQYNKNLSDELKKVKGDVIAAINSTVKIDLGKISTTNKLSVLDAQLNYYGLSFKNNYPQSPNIDPGFQQKISGISKFYVIPNNETKTWTIKPDSTVIDTNLMNLKITYGFKELDKQYKIFAISASPKVTLTDLAGGYFIDKQPSLPPVKPKKWGIGPSLGFGLFTTSKLSQTAFGFNIGASLHYNILQW